MISKIEYDRAVEFVNAYKPDPDLIKNKKIIKNYKRQLKVLEKEKIKKKQEALYNNAIFWTSDNKFYIHVQPYFTLFKNLDFQTKTHLLAGITYNRSIFEFKEFNNFTKKYKNFHKIFPFFPSPEIYNTRYSDKYSTYYALIRDTFKFTNNAYFFGNSIKLKEIGIDTSTDEFIMGIPDLIHTMDCNNPKYNNLYFEYLKAYMNLEKTYENYSFEDIYPLISKEIVK